MPDLKRLLCNDLNTSPVTGKGLILVTGATGYIGGHLIPELLGRHYKVRVMIRSHSDEYKKKWPGVEVAVADVLKPEQLNEALKGVDTAYYLIHSLLLGEDSFEQTDIRAATNFHIAAEKHHLKRIIYLGGLGDSNSNLSPHLKNRILVGEKLSEGKTPITTLRAGMIIGSGSASYEILSYLIKNTAIFFVPKWAKTKAQPISLRDVIKYLVGVIEIDDTIGKEYDIGGSTILSYHEKLIKMSRIMNKKRLFLPALITTPALYGFLASLLTPVPPPVTKALIKGCINEVICHNNDIRKLISFEPLSFDEAIKEALQVEEESQTA